MDSQEVTLTRIIQAHPAQVWAAFTSAEGWRAWCCEQAECDGRVGGKFHIFTNGYNACGEFTDMEPDRKVTFTWYGDGEPAMLNQVALEAQAEHTRLEFKVTVVQPTPDLLAFLTFLERTWGHALDNLKRVLEESI